MIKLLRIIILSLMLLFGMTIGMIISVEIQHYGDEILWKQEFKEQGFEYPVAPVMGVRG